MFRKSMLYVLPAVLLVIVAGITIRTAFATTGVVSMKFSGNAEVERNRNQLPLSIAADRSYDEVERNRSQFSSSVSPDAPYSPYDEVERIRAYYNGGKSADAPYSPYDEVARNRAYQDSARSVDTSYDEVERNRSNYPTINLGGGLTSVPDLSDYVLRHPELIQRTPPDLSDWFLRHRGEFAK